MTAPNPGSEAALEAGCVCAVLDNNHGKGAPFADDGWWITEGCPVHDPATTSAASDPRPVPIADTANRGWERG